MKDAIKRKFAGISMFSAVIVALLLAGCGSGGKLSSEVVSGVAAVGLPLAGQVSLKDSSEKSREKVAIIDKDGSFAFDVSGMKPPYILQAKGSAEGKDYKLHSFAEGTGIANVNPLSDAIVACAAGVSDPSSAYDDDDGEHLEKIKSNWSNTVDKVLAKLQPLLARYGATHTNPITSKYIANHLDLDKMFDEVKITLSAGVLSIINGKSGAVIYSGNLSDIASGNFYPDNIPPAPAAPPAPTGVSAVGGTGQVTLAWAPVSDATSYNVYYATSSGVTSASGSKLVPSTNSYLQTGLAAGTTYYYVVTAVNSAGESAASTQVQATVNAAAPSPAAPSAPAGVTATGGTSQATISWPAVLGATSYNIYWSKTSGVTTATGSKLSNATSPAVHAGLSDGTTYYYIVTAVNGVGESAASVQVAASTLAAVPTPTAPGAVTGLGATGAANQVTLSWQPVAGASSYNIYWSNSSGVTTATGTRISGATSPYVHTGLSAGAGYYYVVTAQNGVGEGIASTQATATTNAPSPSLPAVPGGVSATGGANQATISWQAVSAAAFYNIYYSTSSGVTKANGSKISNAASPYLQTGLPAGTTYYYIVTAQNSAGESAGSLQVSAATSAPVVLDGLALYNQYCSGCHGTAKLGKTSLAIQGAINANTGGMGFLSTLSTEQVAAIATTTAPAVPPPAPACGSCHAIPPATGRHSKHTFTTCATCHGAGYSSTTVNSATHANGVKDVGGTSGWNAAARTCANSCHGSRAW